jgi:hypothetical protein
LCLEQNILYTTSDDRSARVWRLQWAEGCDQGLARWSAVIFTPQHVLYGHVARVFRLVTLYLSGSWYIFLLPDGRPLEAILDVLRYI